MTWGGSPFFTCTRDGWKPPARRGGGGPAGHSPQQQEQLQPTMVDHGGPDLDPGLGPQQQQQPMAMERGGGGHPIAEAIEVTVVAGGGQEGWAPAARSTTSTVGPP